MTDGYGTFVRLVEGLVTSQPKDIRFVIAVVVMKNTSSTSYVPRASSRNHSGRISSGVRNTSHASPSSVGNEVANAVAKPVVPTIQTGTLKSKPLGQARVVSKGFIAGPSDATANPCED